MSYRLYHKPQKPDKSRPCLTHRRLQLILSVFVLFECGRFIGQFRITANACYILPSKVTLASTLEHRASDQGTKVRISEDNTKQKSKICAKNAIFWGLKKHNVHKFKGFEFILLRKSVDFLNICSFFCNFVNRKLILPTVFNNEEYLFWLMLLGSFPKDGR